MAAKAEQKGFLNTVINWAKWTAIGFLGIDSLLLLGAPVVIVASLLSAAANGALIGGVAGGIYGGLQEIGKALTTKQSAPKAA